MPTTQQHTKRLRSFIGEQKLLGRVSTILTVNSSEGPQLQLCPVNFIDALRLQLVQKLTGDANFRTCRHCGRWFEVGPGTGRRLDAKFCTDEHRVLFNSLKRSKGG
jgi:hypothetical protein